ncbi:MAG: hypothetical protein NVS1B11_25850 [Terriglobales bacterium]
MDGLMTSENNDLNSAQDICGKLKHLLYEASQSIRLYGEEYEILSDPFLEGNSVALRVRSRKDPSVRTIHLPSMLIQSIVQRSFTRAA